jgi:hypothetical protein
MKKLRKNCLKKVLYVLGVIMAVACSRNNNGTEELITVKVNLGATLDKETMTGFQERIFIEKLVPLETNDSSLLGIISQVVVSGQNLFILDVVHIGPDAYPAI